eukprot:853954-Pelagomonas_calceolata.AAC.2
MEYLSRTVRGVAQRVTARWTGGALVRGVAVPLGRSNQPPGQLMPQGAEFRWMPAPDEMELPDATALHPAKRVPPVNGRGTERINALAPYVARLFADMMEKAEIPTCLRQLNLHPYTRRDLC